MDPKDDNDVTLGEFQSLKKVADLQEGTHIGRYQILRLIGKGGMGAVYQAYDPELDRSIAIKILTLVPQEGETATRPQARLMREAQALAKLSHPNVVAVHDVGTFEESVYIAMEYVQGKTIREWVKDKKPTQKEIIQVLLKAGTGLHSAHSEGIVHRDFKPDNVIVGDKGQVKVLDFGLARAAEGGEPTIFYAQSKSLQESTSGERLLSTPLTRAGAIVGTTVYMAPEHFLFQDLDEKTDQFSFCVTLFEVLYGTRPFLGKTVPELEKNITAGRIEKPGQAGVPNWIEEIICKGLSVSKEERYASLSHLLIDLGFDPDIAKTQLRKKQFLVAAFTLSAMVFLTIGYALFSRSGEICTGAERKLAGVWSHENKAKISQAFAKTGLRYATDTHRRLEKRLNDYLDRWKNQYTETCEATRVLGEQSEEIMDLKMNCLIGHLRSAQALMKLFGEADKAIVEKAAQAVSSLSGFSNCEDGETLRNRIKAPKDEQTKNKVDAIRKTLLDVEALEKIGKYQEGLNQAQDIDHAIDKLDYEPVRAEVFYLLGKLLCKTGQHQEAVKSLTKAALAAGKSRDALLAAKSMSQLTWVVGYIQARYEEAFSFALNAEVMLSIAGGDATVKATLHNNRGVLFFHKNEYDQSLESFQKSLEISEQALGPDHPLVAKSLNNMGLVYSSIGKYTRALDCLLKTLEIDKKVLGPQHPELGFTLNSMGIVYSRQESFNKAHELFLESLSIKEKALGRGHPKVATTLTNLGELFDKRGEHNKALQYFRRAQTIWEKAVGADHPITALPLSFIGNVFLTMQKPKKALKALERSVSLCKRKTCQPQTVGRGLFGLGRAILATGGDKERAIEMVQEAENIYGKNPTLFKRELKKVHSWLKISNRGLSMAKQ